ncbi:MAG: hypothetical protein AAGA25_08865 [Planctomycetota bacterium]
MSVAVEDSVCLWVEGVKLSPSAEKVLTALVAVDNDVEGSRVDATAPLLAAATGLTAHVVRARLCDLRRLGLAHSYYSKQLRRAVHSSTDFGRRRQTYSR